MYIIENDKKTLVNSFFIYEDYYHNTIEVILDVLEDYKKIDKYRVEINDKHHSKVFDRNKPLALVMFYDADDLTTIDKYIKRYNLFVVYDYIEPEDIENTGIL